MAIVSGKILLLLDGTELGEAALPYGEELAAKLDKELILLHVRGRDSEDLGAVRWSYLNRVAECVARHLEERRPDGGRARVSTMHVDERPGSVCSLVVNNDIEMIIMAASSRSGPSPTRRMGFAAERGCQRIPVPIMLVSPRSVRRPYQKQRLFERILVPLDDAAASKLALPAAEKLAVELNAGITLFQAAHTPIPFTYTGDGMTSMYGYVQLNQWEVERVEDELVQCEAELKAKGIDVNHLVISGLKTAEEIVEAAKKVGADLIVMSGDEVARPLRPFFVSLAQKVLQLGDMPVVQAHSRAY